MPNGDIASVGFSFVRDGALDGPTNMGRDIELLEVAELGRAGCRVYSWNGAWVSIGRFQRPQDALYDPDGTLWVTRPTGGKAVLHGHDVTVGLAVPLAMLSLTGPRVSIKAVYTQIAQPLIQAMRECGLPAALAADTQFAGRGPRVADCFAHISPNDIVDESTGIKVCGCALRLTQRAVLVQASIPAGRPLVDPQTVIRQAVPVPNTSWDARAYPQRLEKALSEIFPTFMGGSL